MPRTCCLVSSYTTSPSNQHATTLPSRKPKRCSRRLLRCRWNGPNLNRSMFPLIRVTRGKCSFTRLVLLTMLVYFVIAGTLQTYSIWYKYITYLVSEMPNRKVSIWPRAKRGTAVRCRYCGKHGLLAGKRRRGPWGNYFCAKCHGRWRYRIRKCLKVNPELKALVDAFPYFLSFTSTKSIGIMPVMPLNLSRSIKNYPFTQKTSLQASRAMRIV